MRHSHTGHHKKKLETRSGPNIPAVDLLEGGDFFGLDHFCLNEITLFAVRRL